MELQPASLSAEQQSVVQAILDPVLFAKTFLQTECWEVQAQILREIAKDHARVAVKACHSSSKCVASSELITLGDGSRVTAGSLAGKVFPLPTLDEKGNVIIAAARAEVNAVEEVFIVTTDSGRQIIRNAHHPLWRGERLSYNSPTLGLTMSERGRLGGLAKRKGSIKSVDQRGSIVQRGWTPVSELKPNDLVAMTDSLPVFGDNWMNEEQLKVLAYLIGDGGLTAGVSFTQQDNSQLKEFKGCAETLGCVLNHAKNNWDGVTWNVVGNSEQRVKHNNGSHRVNPITNLVREYNLYGKRSEKKFLPSKIFTLSKKQISIFLSRLFATDGFASTYKDNSSSIGYTSVSERLVRDISDLLLRFGITGVISSEDTFYKKEDGTKVPCQKAWHIVISASELVIRFCDEIGIFGKEEAVSKARQCALLHSGNPTPKEFKIGKSKTKVLTTFGQGVGRNWRKKNSAPGTFWEKVKSVEFYGVEQTIAIEVPDHGTYLTAFWEHNTFSAAIVALWFLARYTEAIVVTTAPCYDSETEILTDKGWKKFQDVLFGKDKVAQVHPDGTLEFVYPDGIVQFPYDGELLGYKSKLVDFLITPDHRCFVDTHYNHKSEDFIGEVKLAKDIYSKNCIMQRDIKWQGEDTGVSKESSELLGYWFAEGSSEYDEGHSYKVGFHTKNDKEYAKDLLKRNNFKFTQEGSEDGTIALITCGKELADEFVHYSEPVTVTPRGALASSSKTKRVPDSIKNATPEIIESFLFGYWTGDGHTDKNGSTYLCTSSKDLAGDLQELYAKVGIISNVYGVDFSKYFERGTSFSPNVCYYVHTWKKRGKHPRLTAPTPKVKSGWYKKPYKGFVHCVSVPTGLVFVRRNGKTIISGNTWNQVEKLLWGEIHSALARSNYDYPKANQTELNFLAKGYPKRYAQGLATAVTKKDEGVKFQGYHAENLLFILDEAPGVDPKLWEAIEGAAAGGNVRILAIGNPTISGGPFHECFTKSRAGWVPITISAFDTPNLKGLSLEQLIDPQFPDAELDKNILSYLTTRRWVRNQYFKWGKDHPFFQARVLGNFPLQAEDALLSLTWLEQASTDYIKHKLRPQCKGRLRAGLDVAGPGEDETSLTIVDGPEIILHKQWTNPDPRGEVVFELNKIKSRLDQVNVDVIGIGSGMYYHLKDLKFPVQPINICETSSDTELFADCKAEYYWGLRLRFEQESISGLTDQDTIGQLASIKWKVNSRGQIDIESKEDARKRGVPSPDRAESIMLAFAGRNPATFGVLEYLKQVKKQQENKAVVPLSIIEALPPCPTCTSPSAKTQNHFRCQQCGLEFGQEPKKQEVVNPSTNLTNRKAYLDRLERAKRFRMR